MDLLSTQLTRFSHALLTNILEKAYMAFVHFIQRLQTTKLDSSDFFSQSGYVNMDLNSVRTVLNAAD